MSVALPVRARPSTLGCAHRGLQSLRFSVTKLDYLKEWIEFHLMVGVDQFTFTIMKALIASANTKAH
jgi:hypothetical protein